MKSLITLVKRFIKVRITEIENYFQSSAKITVKILEGLQSNVFSNTFVKISVNYLLQVE